MSDIINYSIKGVGSSLQLGKGGGKLGFDTANGTFKATAKDGSTLSRVQVATPVNASDATTKEYVDSLSAGLDPKGSVRVATTADLGATYDASAGANSTGGFTAAPNVVDGETLVDGDRVLVKNQTDTLQNGIYEVVTAGTGADGVWQRALDQDGSPAAEVSAGNFVFVEQGAAGATTGWVVQGSGLIDLNTDAIVWVQFSEAGQINTDTGISLTGNTVELDYTVGLASAVAAEADEIAIYDASTGTMAKTTIASMINSLDVVKGISADGFVARTADDTYASRTFQSGDGLVWTNADGIAGDPTLSFDFASLAAVTAPADGSQEVIVNNGGTIEKISFNQLLADKDLVSATADGILVRTAAGTYASRTLEASSAADEAGIVIANGDGVSGNMTVGLDINGLTAAAEALDVLDEVVFFNASTGANEKVTLDTLGTYIGDNYTSANSIEEGDTSVAVSDSGTGAITITVDGVQAGVWDASGLQANQIIASNLAEGRVVFAGVNGQLVDDAAFTFDSATGALSSTVVKGDTVEAANLTSGRLVLAGANGQLVDDAALAFSAGVLTVTGAGDFSGNLDVGGDADVVGNLSVGGTFSAAGLADSTLTVDGGLVFTDASGDFDQSAGVIYDSVNDKVDIDAAGGLDVADINISGNTITTLGADQDLVLLPNGSGEVIIGSGGAGAITADTGESLVIEAGENTGNQNAGDVVISGGAAEDGQAGDVELRGGSASGTGTNGTVKLIDANGNLVAEVANSPAGAVNNLEFVAGAAGVAPVLRATGTDTDVGLTLATKGTGLIDIANDSADVAADIRTSGTDTTLVTKAYVDEEIAGNVVPGSIASLSAAVDLTAAGTVSLGTIPAGSTVMRVSFKVNSIADTAAEVLFDDSSAVVYMSADENDPEVQGVFETTPLVTVGGSDVTAQFTVTPNGATEGAGVVVVEYRNS